MPATRAALRGTSRALQAGMPTPGLMGPVTLSSSPAGLQGGVLAVETGRRQTGKPGEPNPGHLTALINFL